MGLNYTGKTAFLAAGHMSEDVTSCHGTVPPIVLHAVGRPTEERARRRSYKKTAHRGVLLIKPTPPKNPHWRGRWADPGTNKRPGRHLEEAAARTAERRTAYAKRLHATLRRRTEDLASGAARKRSAAVPLAEAFNDG